jgi:hypothetical protein
LVTAYIDSAITTAPAAIRYFGWTLPTGDEHQSSPS